MPLVLRARARARLFGRRLLLLLRRRRRCVSSPRILTFIGSLETRKSGRAARSCALFHLRVDGGRRRLPPLRRAHAR